MQNDAEQARGGDILTRSDRPAAELNQLFYRRLERLVELRRGKWGKLNPDEERMTNRAIYSTLLDCLELEVAGEARALVRRHFGEPRSGEEPPAAHPPSAAA
ncbi:MAG: hypothetical protein NTZ05_06745 [Chloroflexi bacterium]|nr:hypothetical protein [Chloroflexota bacterium]